MKEMKHPLDERIARNLTDLIQIFRIMRSRSASDATKHHPMDPHYQVLNLLMHGNLPISEIGKQLQRSKPNMTAIIGKLLQEGRIRKVADKSDGRVTRISITSKGRKAMAERMEKIRECIKSNLAALDKKDKERLCASLEVVNGMARKVSM